MQGPVAPASQEPLRGEPGKQIHVHGGDCFDRGQALLETQRKVGVRLSGSQESHQW